MSNESKMNETQESIYVTLLANIAEDVLNKINIYERKHPHGRVKVLILNNRVVEILPNGKPQLFRKDECGRIHEEPYTEKDNHELYKWLKGV